MHLYDECVQQPSKMLRNLDRWLAEAAEHAEARAFDPDVLLGLRLSPDMFALTLQIQSATDSAKFAAARLADKPPPKHADDETTLEQLRARIANVVEFLESLEPADFEGGEDRLLALPFLPEDKRARGGDYLREFAVPNFYFHLTTAYGILRQAGVRLGKRAFIGDMALEDV